MKKFFYIVAFFVAMVFLSVSTTFAASKIITLQPGWNTFSTPKVLSALSFSNGNGAGLFFYSLGNNTWTSVQANIANIRPLEGFVINNTNTGSVQVNLDYATNLAPSDMLFQKTLSAGWNFVGISTDITPFGGIGSNASMSVDFTRTTGGVNLTNGINSSFSTTTGNANIAQPELGEAYAVFSQSSGIYGGSQNQEQAVYATGSVNISQDIYSIDTNIVAGSSNQYIYQMGLSSTGSNPVSISNISFNIAATGSYQGNVSVTLYVSGIAVATKTITGSTLDFTGLNILVPQPQPPNSPVFNIPNGINIELVANFNSTFSTGTIQATLNNLGSATAMQKPAGQLFTIVPPLPTILNVARTDGLGTTPLAAGAKGVTVYAARFSSTQGNPIALSNLSATTAGNALSYTGGNTSLTLYVDGVAVSTKSLTTTTVDFAGFNSTVSTTQAVDIMIKADFSNVTTTGSFSVASIVYSAVDSLTSAYIASTTSTSLTGATFNIAAAIATLSASSSPVNKSLFTAGSTNQQITSFRVTASNDAIKLKDIVLTGANLDALSNIRLVDSAGTVISYASMVSATGATFSNLNFAYGTTVGINQSLIFYVLADVNSTTNVNGVVANVAVAGSDILGITSSAVVVMTGTNVPGASHDITTNSLVVVQNAPTFDLATSAMEFTVYANGTNDVTLSGATFDNTVTGYTGSMMLTIVRKSDNVTVGSLSGTTGTIVFNTNATIPATTSVTYVVKIAGAVVNIIPPNTPFWLLRLTHLTTTGGIDAANYTNTGGPFPIMSLIF